MDVGLVSPSSCQDIYQRTDSTRCDSANRSFLSNPSSPSSSPRAFNNSSSFHLSRTPLTQSLKSSKATFARPAVMAAPTPIHALPVELLDRIFLFGLQDEPDLDDRIPGMPNFEVLISHVCQHWREVAFHNANLWTTIHFRTVPHMSRAEAYLSRSCQHLIDIVIDTCSEDEYVKDYSLFRGQFHPVFNIVTPHIYRWRSLSLKVRDLECKAGARRVLSTCGTAPALETLQLWHIEDWGTAERLYTAIGPPPVIVFGGELPSLRNVSMIGVNLPWRESPFLRNLITIEFALHSDEVRMPYELWLSMLRESPRLEKMTLLYSGPRLGNGLWPEEIISLPNLTEINLTDLDPPYLCMLFNRISAPNVKRLRLELDRQDFSPFLDFLVETPPVRDTLPVIAISNDTNGASANNANHTGPYFPYLESLVIVALECTAQSWQKFLRSLNNVKNLELDFERVKKDGEDLFLQLLSVDDRSSDDSDDRKGKGRSRDSGYSSTSFTSRSSPSPLPSPSPSSSTPSPSSSSSHTSLLPSLETLRLSNFTPTQIRALISCRRSRLPGKGPKKWLLDERMKDAEMERFLVDCGLLPRDGEDFTKLKGWEDMERVQWFRNEEEEEEEEGEDVMEEEEGSDVDEDEEGGDDNDEMPAGTEEEDTESDEGN